VTAEVIDGPQSVVFDGAENRMHAQKGILAWSLGANR
jgi:ornithine carbamoyltransferase